MKKCRLVLITCLLAACSHKPVVPGSHLVDVQAQVVSNTLFYSGNIQPIKTVVIPSPVDGVIVDAPFQYGAKTESGELLFLVSSSKFLADYKTALIQYVKTKSEFNNGQIQLSEAEFLHKNQLISDDEYKMKKSNFYGNQLALLQAKDVLENLLRQLDIKDINLYQLTIADIDKITQAMHLQARSENMRVLAPVTGTILSPMKNEGENKKVEKGDAIKQGDVLAIIGDMSGISVRIKVNELTVNQLKVGQKVKITGIAFPDEQLNGEIRRVDRQAETVNNGLPSFPVEIVVPSLTLVQQKLIHSGMSANVEITIEEEPRMMVPMNAITEKNAEAWLKKYDEKSGRVQDVLVKTGKTTTDAVAILAGIKPGDHIVVPD